MWLIFLILSLSPWWSQYLVLSVVLCYWFLFCFVCHFSSLIFCHLCGLNLVVSVGLCHWLFVLWVIFSHSFSVTLVVSILCCQSLSVIDSCFVWAFSSFILCHLCGLNLVLSVTLCHWLLFCQSFFQTHSLSPWWSQFCVVNHFLSLTLVLWVLFFSLFFCHLCGLNLVLSITVCHWLCYCQSIFLIVSLFQSCVVSHSLSLILVFLSVLFSHFFSVTLVVSILCWQSLSVIDFCSVSPCFSFFLCCPCVVSHSLSLTLAFCLSFSLQILWFALLEQLWVWITQKNQTWLPDRCSSGHIDPLGWAPIYTMPVQAYVVLPSKQHCTLWCGISASSNQNLSKVIPLERQHNHTH